MYIQALVRNIKILAEIRKKPSPDNKTEELLFEPTFPIHTHTHTHAHASTHAHKHAHACAFTVVCK
jgi:ABC-type nickel/cobalt efflux system permease component RcnA